ncbi:MAG: WG repeat-containing protein [Armatimonadetes bacterium]|nr:WG repeat-containing protein [Armatimonadota bacterium]
MAANDIDQRLRALFDSHAPQLDRGAFVSRLHEKAETRPAARWSRRAPASGHRRGRRAVFLAAVATIAVAALAIASLEVVKYMGRDHSVLVIGDGPIDSGKASGLYPVSVDGEWGYIDNTGAIKIAPQFDSAGEFSEGLARIAYTEDGETKQGYIDTSGKVVIRPQFAYAEDFFEGMAVVGELDDAGNPNVCGYIDTSGALAIPMRYVYALRFQEGFAVVGARGGGAFFIDKTGATLWGPFDLAMGFCEGLSYVRKGDRQGFIDKNGDWAIELESATLDMSSYLSSIFPFPTASGGFSEGLMGLQSTSASSRPAIGDADKGYIDTTGAWVIEPQFNHECTFSEGLAAVCLGGKWGYVDRMGTWVIRPQFDFTQGFVKGMAVVGTRESDRMRFGYIDRTGALVVPAVFAEAHDFCGGIAQVFAQSDTRTGGPTYIDRTGTVVWQAH